VAVVSSECYSNRGWEKNTRKPRHQDLRVDGRAFAGFKKRRKLSEKGNYNNGETDESCNGSMSVSMSANSHST
jgi:hypothetical protein